MASPVSRSGIKLEMLVEEGKAIVRMNGKEYEFTVHVGSGKGWKDVTTTKDWKQLAQHVAEYFQAQHAEGETKPIVSAELVLSGDFADVEAEEMKEKEVTVHSAQVTFREGEETKVTKYDTATPATPKINETLSKIGQEFASIRPMTSPPGSAPSARPATSPTKMREVDPLKPYYENRPHALARVSSLATTGNPSAIYALADQLSKMPSKGNSNFNGQSVNDIQNALRREVSDHFNKNKGSYAKSDKFNSIFASLREIADIEYPQLENAAKKIKEMNPAELSSFLAKDSHELKEKEQLVQLYANYIGKDTQGSVIGDLFLRAFVEIHATKEYRDKFQVLIVDESRKPATRSVLLPPEELKVDTSRCAFLYLGSGNTYESYVRTRDKKLPDLNQSKFIDPTIKHEPVPTKAPAHPTLSDLERREVNASGQCLDSSIAIELIIRERLRDSKEIRDLFTASGELTATAKAEAVERAKGLRRSVADYLRMKAEALLADQNFMRNVLAPTIRNIREERPEDKIIDTALGITEDKEREITHDEQETAAKAIIDFYANYITKEPMNNWLDHAFMDLLARIEPSIKVAVVQGNIIASYYPSGTLMTDENASEWVFIEYNGSTHYYAAPTTDPVGVTNLAKIQVMLHDGFVSKLREFLYLSKPGSKTTADQIMEQLLDLEHSHPEAYARFAQLVYDHDLAVWEKSEKTLPKPGTTAIDGNENTKTPAGYGRWRIANAKPDELKATLATFTEAQFEGLLS